MGKEKRIIIGFLKSILVVVILYGFNIQRVKCATPIISSIEITYHNGILLESGSVKKYAYTVNENPYMRVKINSSCSEQVTLLILGKTISGNGLNICYSTNNIVPYNASINIDIPIPNYVTKYNFIWEWTVTAIPNCNSSGTYESNTVTQTTSQLFYVILDSPKAPMSTPWVEVLDYACSWANGQSSITGVKSSITTNLYNCGVEYNGSEHYTKDSYAHLHLTALLNDLSSPEDMQMDCRDFSNFLQVLTSALGVSGNFNRIRMRCNYNYLYPAGWPSIAKPGYWNYHQVGWYSSKVADAATKIDNDSDPTSSPHSWKLAIGDMTLSDYLDKLTEYTVYSEATGTCTVY